MASTGSVDGWPLGPTELGEAGLRVNDYCACLRRRVRATQNLSHNTRFSDNIRNYYVAIQASQNRTMHTPVTAVMCTDQHFQSH